MSGQSEHQLVRELLPWFVNGTLPASDRARLEEHVSECMTCYAALQRERRLHQLINVQPARSISSAEHGYERLLPRLEGRRGRSHSNQRRTRLLALAACLAAIGGTALLWTQAARETSQPLAAFGTVTDSDSAVSGRLDVVFVAELPEAELRELLRANEATIIGGPTEIGRYTIQLVRPLSEADVDVVIGRLRDDSRVRFVGRSFIEGRVQ